MQVVAWALWFERAMARREWLEPDGEHDLGCWSFDGDTWRTWLLANAHRPPTDLESCACRVHRQLCAYRFTPNPRQGGKSGLQLFAFNDLMKHMHPEFAVEALSNLDKPFLRWLDGR